MLKYLEKGSSDEKFLFFVFFLIIQREIVQKQSKENIATTATK